jgi:isopentenyl-diphosphate Delta-isomerase
MTQNTDEAIVSSDSEQLILVNADDEDIGRLSKRDCHEDDGILHRAFSVFVFNNAGEVLLQKRSAGKRLWPLFWSNACCSHPRYGETLDEAVPRRLEQELGITTESQYVYKFIYQASFDSVGSEHELCSVWFGRAEAADVKANSNEIEEWRFFSMEELDSLLVSSAGDFTPWMKIEWDRLKRDFSELLPTV